MPNKAWSSRRWCDATHRSSQRTVRSIARSRRAVEVGADASTLGGQSSNAMMMSAPSSFCTCIDRSGVSSTSEPSMIERNTTPSSLMRLRSDIENTWYPPLSVRIGPSQRMNRCSPPSAATVSLPGLSIR